MIGPSHLRAVLEVPAAIRDGLATGDLIAWGGTIRDQNGCIRALLTEGRGLVDLVGRGIPLDPRWLTDAIGHARTAANLASGIGLLNLGGSAAGFAVIRQQLDAVAEQLQTALTALAEIKNEVEWIRGLQMARIRGDIDSAIGMATRAYRLADRSLFIAAKSKAFEIRRILHHALLDKLAAGHALDHREVFLRFVQASAGLAIAEAQCDDAVEGAAEAERALREARNDLLRLVEAFNRRRRDFAHDPEAMIRLGSSGRRAAAETAAELSAVLRLLDDAAGRLALRAALGLTAEKWRELTAPEGSGLVTCLMPPQGVEGELVDWIRDAPGTREDHGAVVTQDA